MRKLLLSLFLILSGYFASAQLNAPQLEFSDITKTGFKATVVPDDTTGVRGIEVIVIGNGVNDTTLHALSGGSTFITAVFSNLLPGASYDVHARILDCVTPPCTTASSFTSKVVTTLVAAAPRAALETTSNCPQYVGLTWTIPNTGGPVTNIIVMKSHGGPWYHLSDLPPYTTEYYDFDAQPGIYTAYKLYTVNALGELTESNTVSVTVRPYVAPAAPMNLRAVSKTNNSITVMWDNPEEDWVCRSDIRASYYISLKRAWESEYKVYGVTYPNANTFTIEGLEENEWVDIAVWSFSDQDIQGGWAFLRDKTHGPSVKPTNVIGVAYKDNFDNWALGISWNHAGDDADYYYIDYSLDGENWTNLAFVKTGVNVIQHVNLNEGLLYTYRVKAGNYIYGESDYAYMDGYVSVTPDKAPTAPYGLKASWSGSDVVLTWVDDTNKEEKYIIERSTKEDADFAKVGEVERNKETYTDALGANPADTYYYRVKAENAVGSSDYSKVVKVTKTTGGGGATMVVYPNPTADKINVNVPSELKTAPVEVNVYNQINQLIYSKTFKADAQIEVNLKKFTPGAYNVVVSSGNFKETKKIVKN
jgi:hypothetical protein